MCKQAVAFALSGLGVAGPTADRDAINIGAIWWHPKPVAIRAYNQIKRGERRNSNALQEHNQMLSNMVQTCKPGTAATGALHGPPPIVTQLTLVAFKARGDSGLQPKKKRRKKK